MSDLRTPPVEGAAPDRTSDRTPDRAFAALRSLARRHRGRVVLVTVARATAAALLAMHPYFLAEFATSTDDPDRALRFLALLFGTGAIHFLLWTGADFYVSARIIPLTYEFKRAAFDTVWSEDYRRFVDRPSGKVASYVNDLRNHTESLWDAAHYGFLPVLSAIPIYVVLLWQTAPGNAITYGLFLVGAGVILSLLVAPVHARQRHLTDTTANNTGRVFDSYANFVNVFSFRAQAKEIRRNDRELDGLITDDVRFSYALSSYWGVASALIRIGLWGAVMAFSWWQFDQGRITFTAMVVSITVLLDFTTQYWGLVHNLGEWFDKSASFREAYGYLFGDRDIIADPPRERDRASAATVATIAVGTATAPVALRQALDVRDLSFAYPDEPDRLVLDGINFRVARGEKLGIVGRSGEGKSTLIKLLLGFYAPTGGQILVDGRPVEPAELTRLQAYVPQDTSLFQETIDYNIGYAVPEPTTPDRIRQAADRASIADFIDSLPAGYETMVGERGIKLSLGQRQRIAIARAFLADADLVILDEATSALDSETEARIQDALDQLWEGRAAIVIAHRLATLNHVDRIIVLDNGRVVEEGTKDELLSAGGLFAGLWDLQQSGLQS
ncbi:MAG: ABC transporter ATP-binding protein [Actinomycetota bacterium]